MNCLTPQKFHLAHARHMYASDIMNALAYQKQDEQKCQDLFRQVITIQKPATILNEVNTMRFFLKGDLEACKKLFKKAEKQKNYSAQIHLSQAFYGMQWSKDATKDFSALTINDLEHFNYNQDLLFQIEIYNAMYDQTVNRVRDLKERQERGIYAIMRAHMQGYPQDQGWLFWERTFASRE